MKDNKKSWIVILSIINNIFSIFSLLAYKTSKEQTLKMFKSNDFANFFPESIREQMLKVYNNDLVYIMPGALCILFTLIILICSIKDYKKYRNIILTMFIFTFLFSNEFLVSICAIIGIIICCKIKTEKKEKQTIPKLKIERMTNKTVIGSMICLFIYFSHFFIEFKNTILLAGFYLLNFIICFYFFKDEIINGFKQLKKHFQAYLSFMLPRIGIMYVIYMIISVIVIYGLKLGMPENQQAVNELPFYVSLPLAVIWAPIVEESLFRGCLRRLVKNDVIFIILSGFIFGIIHTLGEPSVFRIFALMIPYSTIGASLAYIYTKTNNITTTMTWHSAHNFFTLVLQKILFSL